MVGAAGGNAGANEGAGDDSSTFSAKMLAICKTDSFLGFGVSIFSSAAAAGICGSATGTGAGEGAL